jgi:hypothetical protein
MEGFAERAGRELLATGETACNRRIETVDELTAQEAQIAGLARDGRSNPEFSTSCSSARVRLTRRSRYTLKADPGQSFQPQAASGALIDIMPCLAEHHITLDSLRAGMRAGTGSQPMTIPVPVGEAITQALSRASITLRGAELRRIRLRHPELQFLDGETTAGAASSPSAHSACCGCRSPGHRMRDGQRASAISMWAITLWDASRTS